MYIDKAHAIIEGYSGIRVSHNGEVYFIDNERADRDGIADEYNIWAYGRGDAQASVMHGPYKTIDEALAVLKITAL